MAKTKKINWKKAANDAAMFVNAVLGDAHRAVIHWHGPSNTWLAFDTQCPDAAPDGYLKMLCDRMKSCGYEVRASALSDDESSLAVLYTLDPDGPGGDDTETASTVLWDLWRDEFGILVGERSEEQQEGFKEFRANFEVILREEASGRVERYLMEQPNERDRQLEERYYVR